MAKTEPPVIEGRYRVLNEKPKREPIFNHWRNAVPLIGLLAFRGLWMLLTRH